MLENVLKITLRLVFCPARGPRRQLLEVKTSVVFGMTAIAAGVPRPRFQKDRFDFHLEDMKIKSIRSRRNRLRWRRARRRAANPGSEHLPFRVGLRLPEFAACVCPVATSFLCQRVEQQAASLRISWSNQLRGEFKILPRLLLGPGRIARQEGLQVEARGQCGMT